MQTFIDERLRASLPIYCCKMKSPPFSLSLPSSEWLHPSSVCVPPPSSLSSHSSRSAISAHKTLPPPFALHSPSLAREICLTMGGSAQGQIRSHSPRSHSHCFFHPSFSPSLSPLTAFKLSLQHIIIITEDGGGEIREKRRTGERKGGRAPREGV